MMLKNLAALFFITLLGIQCSIQEELIDRKALVQRHNVQVKAIDSLAALTVGNGAFAFTVDATGLQSFPDTYAKGISLGTQSEWGWHNFPNTENLKFEESLRYYDLQGRKIPYGVQMKEPERAKKASDFFRQNPHRLQLGNIGFYFTKKDSSIATAADITNIEQELDLFTGIVHSRFNVDGIPVEVQTASHPGQDAIGVTVLSDLIEQGRLKIQIRFPYPTGQWADEGNFYGNNEKHTSEITASNEQGVTLRHRLDEDEYFVQTLWKEPAAISSNAAHSYLIAPQAGKSFSATFNFLQKDTTVDLSDANAIMEASRNGWSDFWKSGGAIDFTGSTDERAFELERRIILSQYLTRVQCAGNYPPQETGLTFNSWFGKPHLEMHWWHGVHYALWGRAHLLEKSMDWYFQAYDLAVEQAQRQGYTGARWQKMVDHAGNESPSSVGAFIIWQQPHPITFAELLYRNEENQAVLDKYKDIVFATAEFMASFAFYDSVKQRYQLGPGLIPAQERFEAVTTFNPTYELNYWYWGLQTAQQWRERLGMDRHSRWDSLINGLSALPVQEGVYLATESATDTYTNPRFLTDHPSVLGAIGMLPATEITDTAIMRATFNKVWEVWHWEDTWGWDFPMTAMTATRLGMPEKAVEALLMPIRTNTYLINGHNYQDERLRMYLPGNGGVLIAAAIMVAGYDGSTTDMPGIPKDGKWKVKYEGLKKMP